MVGTQAMPASSASRRSSRSTPMAAASPGCATRIWRGASANSPRLKSGRAEKKVESILSSGKWQHIFIRPKVFTYSLFPIWWAASWVNAKPEQRLWENVRPLDPLPSHYRGRYTNVQAAIGLAGLRRLPEFIERTQAACAQAG